MATKEHYLPLKWKQDIGIGNLSSNGQYNNLNLTQYHHNSSNAFSELSKNVSIEAKKVHGKNTSNAAALFLCHVYLKFYIFKKLKVQKTFFFKFKKLLCSYF